MFGDRLFESGDFVAFAGLCQLHARCKRVEQRGAGNRERCSWSCRQVCNVRGTSLSEFCS
jgi:hypothetical protein